MRNPARRSTNRDDAFEADELVPSERVGPPLARTGGKAMLRGLLILIVFGGGWVLIGDRTTWPEWLRFETAALSTWMDRNVRGPVEPTVPKMASAFPSASTEPRMKPAALDPPTHAEQPSVPGNAASAPPLTTATLPAPATGRDDPQAAPLRPPSADPAEPYQMRAEAVGLHPDLSRVLLMRLSPTDYHNAGIAIQTAMAETADSAVFIWPRQRKPELALFKVHFVPGAAAGCRRYVVAVAKDGWVTTALPMEKCGSEAGRARRE